MAVANHVDILVLRTSLYRIQRHKNLTAKVENIYEVCTQLLLLGVYSSKFWKSISWSYESIDLREFSPEAPEEHHHENSSESHEFASTRVTFWKTGCYAALRNGE